ncbi:MAG TPA: WD40 repeat domain-containing protein, partial [Candidatus Sulfotelmatobacter sp.]|nr:WD40 repeat domain-containing protein [Candidatus Sulfotelmatobacter sp.]
MDTEIFDLSTGARLWTIPFNYANEINTAAFTQDGSRLMVLKSADTFDPRRDSVPKISAPKDESERWYEAHVKVSAYLLDARSGRQLSSFPVTFWQPTSIAFSRDSTIAAVSSNDATARLLSIPSGRELQRLEGHDNTIGTIAVSPNWDLIAAADEGPMALVWDLKASQMAPGFGPHRGKPLEVMFNSSGTQLTTKDVDDYHYWDVRARQESRRVGRNTYAGILAITEDAQKAIGYTLPPFQRWYSIVVFNPTDGNKIFEFPLPTFKNVFGPALFGPDGTSVYGIHDERVSKLDTHLGVEKWLSPEQTDSIPSITISSDGSRLLTAGWDHTAKVWNTSSGVVEKTLVGHQWNVEAVAFNQNGTMAVSGSGDETARVWNLSGPSRVVKSERVLKGHIGGVNAVGISPSSDVVVTGGQDGTVRLWRRSDGSEICALIGTGPDRWAVVTPEGRFDTANLDEVKGLHWMFPDDPFHPLNPEIYLRDYYEPRLLSRLLFSTDLNEFRPIRPLESLDRAVPLKPTIRISRENNSDTVTVE